MSFAVRGVSTFFILGSYLGQGPDVVLAALINFMILAKSGAAGQGNGRLCQATKLRGGGLLLWPQSGSGKLGLCAARVAARVARVGIIWAASFRAAGSLSACQIAHIPRVA